MKNNRLTLGDRMKAYENCFNTKLLPNSIFVARLDGRGFSKFTKAMNFEKPFDLDFVQAMENASKRLMEETQATLAYTQSDELTLILKPERTMFSGRIEKICSIFASKMSIFFYQELLKTNPDKKEFYKQKLEELCPVFDCRVFSVLSKREALNAVLWREQDAVKNSILCLSQSHFTKKEMFKVNTKQLVEKLEREKNVRWDQLPINLKRGTYLLSKTKEVVIEKDILDKIPTEKLKELQKNSQGQYITFRKVIEKDESFLSSEKMDENYFFDN